MHELRDLVDGYAVAADRRDAKAFAALFTADAWLEANGHRYAGVDEIATIPARLARYDATLHLVSTHQTDVSGESAAGTAYCEAHHRDADGDRVLYIRYDDTYAKVAGDWRFASRCVTTLWEERR